MTVKYDSALAAMAVAVASKKNTVIANTFTQKSDSTEGVAGQKFSIARGFLTGDVQEIAQKDIETPAGVIVYNSIKQEQVVIELNVLIAYGWKIAIDWSTFSLNATTLDSYRPYLVDPAVAKVTNTIEAKAAATVEAAAKLTSDPTEKDADGNALVLPGVTTVDLSGVDEDKVGKRVRLTLNRANTELLARRQAGNAASEDLANRFVLMGTEVGYYLLSDDFINSYANTQTTDALQRATVAQLANFNIVVTGKVDANSMYAYTKEAFVIFSRTPAQSFGAKFSTIETGGIIAFRYNVDYDASYGSDTGLLSAFVAVSVVNPQFVVGYKFTFPTAA